MAPVARPSTHERNPQTSGEAISSLVLGILSISLLPVLTPIPAIMLARSALDRIAKSRGTLRGSGAAQVGLATGYIGAGLATVALLAAIALSVIGFFHARDAQEKCFGNGKVIAMACRMYAADHQGAFPPTLEALVPKYVADENVFACPYADPAEVIGYEYHGGDTSHDGKRVLLVSKGFATRKRQAVVYVDGSADLVRNMPKLPPEKTAP